MFFFFEGRGREIEGFPTGFSLWSGSKGVLVLVLLYFFAIGEGYSIKLPDLEIYIFHSGGGSYGVA